MEECSHVESNWRRTEGLVINSVLFGGDPADHFGIFGSQWEEPDHDSHYRYRFPMVVHLEEDGIWNGMVSLSRVKGWWTPYLEGVCHRGWNVIVSNDFHIESLAVDCMPDFCARSTLNPLNPELNPICYLLALLAYHFLHVSRIMVKSWTLRLLMSYIYGAPILDVSRSHTTTQHSR